MPKKVIVDGCNFTSGPTNVNVHYDSEFSEVLSGIADGLKSNGEAYRELISLMKTSGAKIELGAMLSISNDSPQAQPEFTQDDIQSFDLEA